MSATASALLLVGTGLLVLALGWGTRLPPRAPVPDAEGYLTRWQRLHDGYDPRPNPWLRGWLLLAFRCARPLARRGVRPDVVTLGTIWLALAVFVPAQAGGRWPILAGWLLVASGLGDTMDGAVAALTDTATRWGYVLDSAVDRVNDVIYLVAVWSVGAPAWLAVTTGALFSMMEYLRVRASNAGAGDVVAVTVGERATRVICCAVALVFGGLFTAYSGRIATLVMALLGALSLVALAQVIMAARRLLADRPYPG
ncbi:MAG: CDP-alcohol phosphatidyltransferase family protein [Egibacteraceae bacterium]